ncbi:MAG: hypothetical protein LUH19_05045, partial [Lachnospiraceae bacterium]|nr:hypothetical protein [Lachnospiraceae bacterium]
TSSHSSYSQKRFVSHPAIFLTSIALIVILIAVMALIRLKTPADNGNTLDKYHVSACQGASESAACLKQLAKDRLSVSLKDASDTSEFVLLLSASEAQANELGYDLSGLQEKGFLISYQGNTLSLLSKSEAGMNRACYYLIYQCINSDGSLTLSGRADHGHRRPRQGGDPDRQYFH